MELLENRLLLSIDLAIGQVDYSPGTYEPDGVFSARAMELSASSGAVLTPFHVRAVLSTDRVLDAGDYVLSDYLEPSMPETVQQRAVAMTCRIPLSTPRGSYYLGVAIDATDAVREFDETNNVQWSAAPDVTVQYGGVLGVTTSPGILRYVEDDAATAVDPAVKVGGPAGPDGVPGTGDDVNLLGATVWLGQQYIPGQDVLEFAGSGAIGGAFDAATGVLSLAGPASASDYQAALRTVAYVNTSHTPDLAPRTVRFTVTDGTQSRSAERTINLVSNPDPPEIAATAAALVYRQGDGAVTIDPGVTLADPDSAQLRGATVAVASGYAPNQDLLEFPALPAGIVGAFDAATGVLSLRGLAPLANYQAALRSVAYHNVAQSPAAGQRQVCFTIDDGTRTASATRSISLVAANAPPVVMLSGGATSYAQKGSVQVIDRQASVSDDDSPDFAGGKLTVRFLGASTADDRLGIRATGTGRGQISLAANAIRYGGVPMGTFTGGDGTTPLEATFSAGASLEAVATLARNITYRNLSQNPSSPSRQIQWTVSDGDGGTSAPAVAYITFSMADLTGQFGRCAIASSLAAGKCIARKMPLTVTNRGNRALAAEATMDVAFYARPVAGGGADVLLASVRGVRVGGLQPGRSVKLRQGLSLPAVLSENTYCLVAVIDPGNLIYESNDANNVAVSAQSFFAGAPAVDLDGRFDSSSLPASVLWGQGLSGRVNVAVRNAGNVPLPKGAKVTVQLVARRQDGTQVLLGTLTDKSLGRLAGGRSKQLSFRRISLAGLTAGQYELQARITAAAGLNETRLDNNLVSTDWGGRKVSFSVV